jgi:hypothetical protein
MEKDIAENIPNAILHFYTLTVRFRHVLPMTSLVDDPPLVEMISGLAWSGRNSHLLIPNSLDVESDVLQASTAARRTRRA